MPKSVLNRSCLFAAIEHRLRHWISFGEQQQVNLGMMIASSIEYALVQDT